MATTTKQTKRTTTARKTKISSVIDLLMRKDGASLDEMSKATGWQKHTVRSALTGLKKKGYEVERRQVEGISRYTITKTPADGTAK